MQSYRQTFHLCYVLLYLVQKTHVLTWIFTVAPEAFFCPVYQLLKRVASCIVMTLDQGLYEADGPRYSCFYWDKIRLFIVGFRKDLRCFSILFQLQFISLPTVVLITCDKRISWIFVRFFTLRIFVHETWNQIQKICICIESLDKWKCYLDGLYIPQLLFNWREVKFILIFVDLKAYNFIDICSFEELLFD